MGGVMPQSESPAFPSSGNKGLTKKEFAAIEAMKAFISKSSLPLDQWTEAESKTLVSLSYGIATYMFYNSPN